MGELLLVPQKRSPKPLPKKRTLRGNKIPMEFYFRARAFLNGLGEKLGSKNFGQLLKPEALGVQKQFTQVYLLYQRNLNGGELRG